MRTRARYALGLLGALVVALLVLQTPLLSGARARAWSAWVHSLGSWLHVGSLTVDNSVEEQIQYLTAENVRLRAELRDFERIREQLGAPSFSGFRAIRAEISARPLDPFHSEFVINRGARDGVTLGAPAVIYGSTLIGFVSNLNDTTATVRLLFHPGTQLPAETFGDEVAVRGLLRGKSFTAVELSSVPRDAPLSVGQEVVTSSQAGLVPTGLFVGRVTTVAEETHEPFQFGRIEVPYDSDSLYATSLLVPQL